jgi:DNA (cytosine-5)-methyltransferase 1
MENVERAPLNASLMLCGSMFGLGVKRHRLFESNVLMLGPPCGSHQEWYAGVFGGRCVGRQRVTKAGPGKRTQMWDKFEDELGTARRAMGIDWMTLPELSEAIPPDYTEWIGRHLLATLVRRVA